MSHHRNTVQHMPQSGQSFAVTHPELSAQWLRGSDNQPDLTSSDVTAGSGKKPWWRCPGCGHEWEATISNRSRGAGCPACAGKVAIAGNNLAVKRPDLAAQWLRGPDANPALTPSDVTAGSGKKPWWRCLDCGHVWKAAICDRVTGSGCRSCGIKAGASKRSAPKPGQSLAEKNPVLAAQWHATRNGHFTPNDVKWPGTPERVASRKLRRTSQGLPEVPCL